VKGVGIDECKAEVLRQMIQIRDRGHARKPSDRPHVIFIDFKSAYDSVTRQKLGEMLLRKRILSHQKLRILEFIHHNLRVSLGTNEVTTSRGVPQGLTTSPLLFNIYVEDILERMDRENIFTAMYADDLVCVTTNRQ
jgi:hypothetical protein